MHSGDAIYRITGKQSVERLEPLLATAAPDLSFRSVNLSGAVDLVSEEPERIASTAVQPSTIDFVWETFCERTNREAHNNARILNRLHNSVVLESKSNFAFVGTILPQKLLPTFVARTKAELEAWAQARWKGHPHAPMESNVEDWWAVKASAANGGRDVHVLHQANAHFLLPHIHDEEVVIQRYVPRPQLFEGRKFHLRCYALLMGDFRAFLHRGCFVLTSSLPYLEETPDSTVTPNAPIAYPADSSPAPRPPAAAADDGYADYLANLRKHVTNLSINKKFANHPGQLPFDLHQSFPDAWTQLVELWDELTGAVLPFMRHQRSPDHFDFYGLDVIVDTDGTCHLLELNRLPGLESSINNLRAEDAFYDEMMAQALQIVLRPLQPQAQMQQETAAAPGGQRITASHGAWEMTSPVRNELEHCDGKLFESQAGMDLLRWKCFVKKNQKSVLAIHNMEKSV